MMILMKIAEIAFLVSIRLPALTALTSAATYDPVQYVFLIAALGALLAP